MPAALIVFLRFPRPGAVKSRLARAVGDVTAADVYARLVRRTLGVVSDFKRDHPAVAVHLSFTPEGDRAALEPSFPGPWQFSAQREGHLGQRMAGAIEDAAARGYRRIVLIGTDLADIAVSDLSKAFAALEASPAVLNPARDGGFYLIGLTAPCDKPFAPSDWGGPEVFTRTRELLEAAGRPVHTGAMRQDIDQVADLHALGASFLGDRLSVVVPTLRAPDRLAPFLEMLRCQLWPRDEILVVCGAPEHAATHSPEPLAEGVRVLLAPKGRGRQLNAGVQHAQGNLLFFLHDDSLPPPNFAYHIRKIAPRHALGCFNLAFAPATPALRALAAWANFRTRCLGLPYGDQGLFCRRETLEALGGFGRDFLMEDVELVRKSRKLGRLLVVPETVTTSARRYLEYGLLRCGLRNHLIMARYLFGTSDERLYALYYGAAPRHLVP